MGSVINQKKIYIVNALITVPIVFIYCNIMIVTLQSIWMVAFIPLTGVLILAFCAGGTNLYGSCPKCKKLFSDEVVGSEDVKVSRVFTHGGDYDDKTSYTNMEITTDYIETLRCKNCGYTWTRMGSRTKNDKEKFNTLDGFRYSTCWEKYNIVGKDGKPLDPRTLPVAKKETLVVTNEGSRKKRSWCEYLGQKNICQHIDRPRMLCPLDGRKDLNYNHKNCPRRKR